MNGLPLPSARNENPPHVPPFHAGLLFDKFFDQWNFNTPDDLAPSSAKSDWIARFAKKRVGVEPELQRAVKRQQALAAALNGRVEMFRNTSRFVTGLGLASPLENGFLWHHCLGVPYLPASAIKGMMRAWVQEWSEDEAALTRLFGAPNAIGALILFDALPCRPVQLVGEIMTPHGKWRLTGPGDNPETVDQKAPSDWQTPVPVPFLAVEQNQGFQFALAPTRMCQAGDLETGFAFLCEALDWIGIGAKSAIGMGRFASEHALQEKRLAKLAQAKAAHAAKRDAEKNWVPKPGDRVFAAGEEAIVIEAKGAVVEIRYDDDQAHDELPIGDIKARK